MNRALIERTLAAMDKGYMGHHHAEYAAVMTALREELEKPESEPVGWATVAQLKRGAFMEGATPPSYMEGLIPLYTKGTP